MGEYVININWSNGGRRSKGEDSKLKTYQKGTSLLPAAVLADTFNQNSVAPDTFYGRSDCLSGDNQEVSQWLKIQQGAVLGIHHHFF